MAGRSSEAMPKPSAEPPFPDSPGAWIACFRHRLQAGGKPLSPEGFGRLIKKSGATVRRWESNQLSPDEDEIARIAEACNLSALQAAFLSAACTRMRATPAPNRRAFIEYMDEVLASTPYPAMLHDGLFYVRAWNSYVDALAPGVSRVLQQDIHPIAAMMRARPSALLNPEEHEETLRDGLRIFWMSTAMLSHRPEYRKVLAELDQEPQFRRLWMDFALGTAAATTEPICFAYSLGGSGARFRVYARTITFPPTYYLNEYHPDEGIARERVGRLRDLGAPHSCFKRGLHWVRAPLSSC